jgi:hypothetical protein
MSPSQVGISADPSRDSQPTPLKKEEEGADRYQKGGFHGGTSTMRNIRSFEAWVRPALDGMAG